MEHSAHAKHENLATMPYRKIKVKNDITQILHLPGVGQRIIIYSWDGSFRVWDLESGTQVGEEWEDKERGLRAIALSPGSKTVATGSFNGAMRLWNVNTGKVIKTWTGHTKEVQSVCWSSDGKRVVSGSKDGTCRVWDIESGETNGKMIATSEDDLKIWDANSGELLKTIERFFTCLAWTSDGKTLIAGGFGITKFNTATWTVVDMRENLASTISLSPNERILVTSSYLDKTAKLWDLEANQPIKTSLHHEDYVRSATFSADGKFLVTSCINNDIYTWDLSAIVNEAGLPSDIADATPKATPKIKGARRIPPGFFDDALRETNLRIRLSQSHGPHNHTTPASRQRTLSRFSSFWRRSRSHGATERDVQIRSRPFSWTRNIVSSIVRRRDGSDIQLREVEVPCTAGKPRNYHARKKPATSSSRPSNTHAMQQHSAATQSIPLPSRQSPPVAITLTLSAVPGTAEVTGATPLPRTTMDSGWRARLMLWVCCMPIQHTDGQH